ncbi:glycohydrolase toxin TNT-related protein [Microbacterium lushaniae]|uniref:DUF4237 domain-containing protein n=1 Tax=Microbacterium lushaniae TaxID=2614639 RepID=A0A5J6L1F2_9MICO|nr:glycohydrolase toxin TNT-related protein [Microbacterium lushaniae]QEW02329.1 DUF4237 domain-containing protein [Microbacterium lushaniae]
MTTRRIDPTLYVQAADAFDAIATSADSVGSSARSSANGYSAMAGDDPGGEQFATAYDASAHAALQNIFDIGMRANTLDRLFMASGGSAASAEAVASGQTFDAGAYTLRPARSDLSVAPPPSAFGGTAGEPTGWDLVMNVVGMMWPNADTDQLDQAGQTWKDIARDVRRLATDVRQADNSVASLDSVELPKARTEVTDFATDIGEVADLIEEIGTQCKEYADDVREAHKEVIEMLVQLAIEIAATIAISAALSAFTFGAAGAAGAAAVTARIAVIGARILTILTKVGGTAARVAVRIRAVRVALIPFATRHRRVASAVINVASGTAAAVASEVIVKRGDANLLAAFGSGLVGGAVTEAITSPFGRYGQRVAVQALAGGGGGAAGAATDGLISDGSIDPRQVVIGAAGGGVFGGASARSGSGRGSSSAADPGPGNVRVNENTPVISGGNNAESGGPDGGRSGTTDYEGPNVSGGNEVSGGGGDGGPAGTTDYEGPNVTGGNDVSGGGGDGGGGPRVPDGEAPQPTGDEGIPSPGGNGGGRGGGGNDPVDVPAPPVNNGGGGGHGLPPGSGSGNGSHNPGGYDPETPIFHDVENDLGMDVDGDGFPASSGGAGDSAPVSSDPEAPAAGGGRPGDADGGRPADADGGAAPAPHTPDADAVPVGGDSPDGDAAPVTGDAPDADSPATPVDPSGTPTDAGDAPATDADGDGGAGTPVHNPPTAGQPDPTGPMYSNDTAGDGWNRYDDTVRPDPDYGQPRPEHGTVPGHYEAPASPNPDIAPMITDPGAPFGRDADGTPIPDQNAWNERYALPDNADGSPGGPRWPTNDGAVPGTRVHYHGVDALLRDYPQFANLDRIGRTSGDYLTVANTPFEQRGLTPGHQGMDLLHRQLAPELPPGIRIEVSVIDDALGYPGGGWQIRFFRAGPDGRPSVGANGRDEFLSVKDLDDLGVFL